MKPLTDHPAHRDLGFFPPPAGPEDPPLVILSDGQAFGLWASVTLLLVLVVMALLRLVGPWSTAAS